ncbi:MAG TPA: hypothetical protein VNT23_02400 [Gaiellaceae bacterium]|nr:hypothetical protein [Gaiellaceae bacterium]
MHAFAAGSAGGFGLVGNSEPPLSPETVGRAPSNFEAPPVPVVPIEDLVGLKSSDDAPAPAPLEPPPAPTLPPAATVTEVAPARRRLIVRFVHGEELELGAYDDRASAHARAQELVQQLSAAEANGEWPEIDGRHLRPAAIVSVDVLVEEG